MAVRSARPAPVYDATTNARPARQPFARGPVAAILLVVVALHLVTLATTTFGLQRDEFLYFSMGRHLRFWRMDFPPLIAIVANASRVVFDHTLAAARVVPMLAGVAIALIAATIARDLGGGRFAQGLTVLCLAAGGVFQRASTLFQPVVFDQLWWTLALYTLVRLSREERGQERRDWIGFGAALALLGLPLNLFNLLSVPLVIGYGIDDHVFLVHRHMAHPEDGPAHTVATTGRGVVLTSLSTIAGFAGLAIARFEGLKLFGLSGALAVAFCLIGAFAVLPALLALFWPRPHS